MAVDSDRLKSWATFALIIAAIGGGTWLIRYVFPTYHGGDPHAPGSLPSNIGVRLTQSEFTIYGAEGTRKACTVRADTIEATADKGRVEARGNVVAELFDLPTGKRRARITAPLVVFTTGSKTLQIAGKIVCRAPGGSARDLAVEADTLVWNIGAKQIFCPGVVHAALADDAGTADGRDFTLDLLTHAWTLKHFRGAFAVGEGQGVAPPPFVNPLKGLPF